MGIGLCRHIYWSVFVRFVLNLLKLGGFYKGLRTEATRSLTVGNSGHICYDIDFLYTYTWASALLVLTQG